MKTATHIAPTFFLRAAAVLCALIVLIPAFALAEEPPCRAKSGEVRIVYPELAKRMKIAGTVRLLLELDKSGSVHAAKALGGNPVLVSAAQDAVKSAKFEGNEPCVISFQFRE